ncbi:unnamed protein product [Cochlearia groenlandica]
MLSQEDEFVLEPLKVIRTRYNDQGHLEALTQWKGIPDHENSWVLASEDFSLSVDFGSGKISSHGDDPVDKGYHDPLPRREFQKTTSWLSSVNLEW